MSKERKKYLKNIKRAEKELNTEWDSVRSNATILAMQAGINTLRKNPKTTAIIGASLTSFLITQKIIKSKANQNSTADLEVAENKNNFLANFGDIAIKVFMQLVEGFMKKGKK